MKTTKIKQAGKREKLLFVLIILEFLAAAYDTVFNEMRMIKPIDGTTYQFQISDIPMAAVTLLLVGYVLYLVILGIVYGFKKKQDNKGITRTVSPRFGWMGFFGFIGFLGIPAYSMQGQVWPFFFFIFFGFFGFFYEGKLSNTLMDERFQEEQTKAQLTAYKTGFGLFWLVAWFVGFMGSHLNTDAVAIIFTVASSLIIALTMFLGNYLLYKYDTEEMVE